MSVEEMYHLALDLVANKDRGQVLRERAPESEEVLGGYQQGVMLPGSDWLSGKFSGYANIAATVELLGPDTEADGERLLTDARLLASMLVKVPRARLVGVRRGPATDFVHVVEMQNEEDAATLLVGAVVQYASQPSSHWFRISVDGYSSRLLADLP